MPEREAERVEVGDAEAKPLRYEGRGERADGSSERSNQSASVSDRAAQSSAHPAPGASPAPLSETENALDSADSLGPMEALSEGDWNESEAEVEEHTGVRGSTEFGVSRAEVRAAQSVPQARSAAFSTRWAPVVAEVRAALSSAEGGWQQMQIELGEGGGSVTVRARREAERVIVSVGFSDPSVRAQAMASADRLHESLQAEFGGNVDFSFDAQSNARDDTADRSQHTTPTSRSRSDARTASAPTPITARPTLGVQASREWVG